MKKNERTDPGFNERVAELDGLQGPKTLTDAEAQANGQGKIGNPDFGGGKYVKGGPLAPPPERLAKAHSARVRALIEKKYLRYEIFCQYMARTNRLAYSATQAGYSFKSASQRGHQLLKEPMIQARIAAIREELLEDDSALLKDTLGELRSIMQSDLAQGMDDSGAFLPFKEWPVHLRRAVGGIKVTELWEDYEDEDGGKGRKLVGQVTEVKLWPKTQATDQIMRKLGAYAPTETKLTHSFVDLVNDAAKEPTKE